MSQNRGWSHYTELCTQKFTWGTFELAFLWRSVQKYQFIISIACNVERTQNRQMNAINVTCIMISKCNTKEQLNQTLNQFYAIYGKIIPGVLKTEYRLPWQQMYDINNITDGSNLYFLFLFCIKYLQTVFQLKWIDHDRENCVATISGEENIFNCILLQTSCELISNEWMKPWIISTIMSNSRNYKYLNQPHERFNSVLFKFNIGTIRHSLHLKNEVFSSNGILCYVNWVFNFWYSKFSLRWKCSDQPQFC